MPRPVLLIVEDHAPTRTALAQIFRLKGWDVREAGSVAEAVPLLDPPPACAVVDLMLPDGRGEDILRMIRSLDPSIRVTVCTGVSDPVRLAEVRALAPSAVLRKPISALDILSACDGLMAPG